MNISRNFSRNAFTEEEIDVVCNSNALKMKFFEELKRRNVIKATMAYVVVAWVLIQVFTNILPVFQAPPWVLQVLMIVLAFGLPIWIVFSWVYDVTPEGLKKTESIPSDPSVTATTNKRLNILILVVLIIAVGLHFLDRPQQERKEYQRQVAELPENAIRENSIAVLPFLDMSPMKDQEHYSKGIAEEILNALCKYRSLWVAGSTSSFSFQDNNENIQDIGQKLNVNNVLEGSVQKQDMMIKISVRLTDASSGYTLFSESYTDSLQNIFSLQSRIARDVAEKIETELELSGNEVHTRKEIDPQAYETFLRGKVQFVNGPLNMNKDEVKIAKKYFEKALELDPTFAEASAYLSLVYYNLTDWAGEDDQYQRKVYLDSARTLARKAHDLDQMSPGAHMAMGTYYYHEYDWINAEKEKRKAVELNPGGVEEKFSLASFLCQYGHAEEALSLSKEALELSPLDPEAELNLIKTYYFTRNYEQCIAQCNQLKEKNPTIPGIYQFLFVCHADLKQYEEAKYAFAELLDLTDQKEAAQIFRENDLKTAMEKSLALHQVRSQRFLNRNIYLASFNAYLENKEKALKHLNDTYDNKDQHIGWMRMARFDFMRDDPHFQELYEKAGLKAYDDYMSGK